MTCQGGKVVKLTLLIFGGAGSESLQQIYMISFLRLFVSKNFGKGSIKRLWLFVKYSGTSRLNCEGEKKSKKKSFRV